MSKKLTKIDASPESKGQDRDLRAECPKTAEEFDVLLARYEKQNPEAFARKLASGEFEKQKLALGIASAPKKEEVKKPEGKEEPKKEEGKK